MATSRSKSKCTPECGFAGWLNHIEGTENLDTYSEAESWGVNSVRVGKKGIHHYGSIKVTDQSRGSYGQELHAFKIGSKWQVHQLETLGWKQVGFGKVYWYMTKPDA